MLLQAFPSTFISAVLVDFLLPGRIFFGVFRKAFPSPRWFSTSFLWYVCLAFLTAFETRLREARYLIHYSAVVHPCLSQIKITLTHLTSADGCRFCMSGICRSVIVRNEDLKRAHRWSTLILRSSTIPLGFSVSQSTFFNSWLNFTGS